MTYCHIFVKTHIYITTESTRLQYQTAYKLMVQKTRIMAACQSIIQMGPQTWNLFTHDIYMRNSLLISCAAFSSRFKRSTLEGYDDYSFFFAHVFLALHILLMSGIGLWGIHQGGSIRFTEYIGTYYVKLTTSYIQLWKWLQLKL